MYWLRFSSLKKALGLLLVLGMIGFGLPMAGMVHAAGSTAKVIFTFDEGMKVETTSFLPILEAAGFQATSYVNPDTVKNTSNPDKMRLAEVQLLYAKGWDIGNRTSYSLPANDAALQALKNLFQTNQNWLINNVGIRGACHVAYPSVGYTSSIIQVLKEIGTLTARTATSGIITTPVTNPDTFYTLPVKSLSNSAGSIDRAKQAVASAVASGTTVILQIGDTTTSAIMQDMVNYVKGCVDNGQIEVMTMSAWYAWATNTTPPVVPPAPSVTNDDEANTVSGMETGMEYNLDSAGYVPYDAGTFANLDFSGNHVLAVRYAASGINPAGPATTLVFTTNGPAPETTARVIFTFDDGWKDQVTYALPILNAAGFRATAYVNRDSIIGTNPTEMRKSDLIILYANGWDIGNHTTNHDSTTLTDPDTLARLRLEYLDNQNWIINNVGARGAYHACYPSGSFMPEYIQMLQEIGALTARTTVQTNQATPITNPDDYYKLPIKSVSSGSAGSIDRTKTAIDNAVRDGTTVILMIHKVEPVIGDLVTTTADFQTVVDYVKQYSDQSKLKVATVSEWYYWLTNTHAPIPEAPPAPDVHSDDLYNTVSGMALGMEYSLDGAAYTAYDATTFGALDFSGSHQLLVRFAACGINPAGAVTTLIFTPNVTPPTVAAAKVLFTFDGSWKSQLTYALPILNGAGFKATTYVMRDFILEDSAEDPTLMNLSDVQSLAANGWDIGNHTTNHDDQGDLTDAATLARLRTEYLDNQNWIASATGSPGAYHIAYPSGKYSQPLIDILKGIGALTARATREANQSIPITAQDDFYKLPCIPFSSDPAYNDKASVKNAVSAAINDGSTVIIFMNQVAPGYVNGNVTVADLQEVVDYVKQYADQGKVSVMTISEWYDWQIAHYPLIPVTPPAPNVTNDDNANTVSGMATGMEYSLDGAAYVTYDATTFGALNFSGDHTLLVRYAASGINPFGPATTLVFTINPVTPPAPNVTNDDNANTVSGMATGMEYSLDGAAYVTYDAATFGALNFSGEHTLLVRYAASGINPFGPATTLVFTINPVTPPAPIVTNDDSANTVSGMAIGMEYSLDGAAYVPYDATTFSALDFSGEHTLLVRYAASGINPFGPATTLVFTTNPVPPAVPENLTAQSASYNSINLAWSAVSGADGYAIYRSTSATGTFSLVTTTTSTTVTNGGLVSGTTYYFKVCAYKMVGTTTLYGNQTLAVSARPVPGTPAGLTATSASYNSIRLTWSAVNGASGYGIYRSTSAAGTFSLLTTTTSTAYTNSSLATGTTYFYKVSAYRLVGTTRIYGDQTAAVSATPVLAIPGSFTVARYSTTSIRVTWGAVGGASGYEIWRATSAGGPFTLIVTTTTRSYINSGLTTGTTYYYMVRAYRLVGTVKVYGDYTTVKSAKP